MRPPCAKPPRPNKDSKKSLKPKLPAPVIAAAVKLEALIPARRRPKILSRLPVGAELIIGGALFRILEHFIGLAHFLEARFGIGFLAHIRMIFAREFAVGPLDLVLGRIPRNAHDLVIVFEFHSDSRLTDTPTKVNP